EADVVRNAVDVVHLERGDQRLLHEIRHRRIAVRGRAPMKALEVFRPGLEKLIAADRGVVLLHDLVRGLPPGPRPVEERTLRVVEDCARPSPLQYAHLGSSRGYVSARPRRTRLGLPGTN